jgi:ABC-2 type transport system permease protein
LVGHFVALKVALIRNGLRGSPLRIALFLVGSLIGLIMALFGFILLALPPARAIDRSALPVFLFTALFVAWLLFPLFGYGLDETLDPDRLALLPLSRAGLMKGLLASSLIGIAPAATLLALLGAVFGYGSLGVGGLLVVAGVGVELLLCLTAARAVTTGLSRLMRSRRARDVWVGAFALFGVALNLMAQALRLVGRPAGSAEVARLSDVLRWFPPGLAGRAVLEAGAGRTLVSVVDLALAAAAVWLLGLWWAKNLDRLTTTTEPARRAAASGDLPRPAAMVARKSGSLFPRVAWFLPRNRRGAVAAKELRYLWREPGQRAARFSSILISVLGVAGVVANRRFHRPEMVLATVVFVWLFSLNGAGLFAMDRSAYWMNAVAPGDPSQDLLGKNQALALINLPVFVFIAVGLAAFTKGWAYLPLTIALAAGVFAVVLGLGNIASVRLAQPMPESTTNVWAMRSGQGCGTAMVMLLVLMAMQILVAPLGVMVLLGLTVWRPLLVVTAPVAVAYGLAVYLVGFRIASNWLRQHQPELLEALSPRHAV